MINPADIRLDSLPWVPLDATAGFPAQPGIYFAIDASGVVQYIGKTKDVKGRWKSHHRFDDLSAIGGIKIAYLFIDLIEMLPEIEQALILWFDPQLNVVGKTIKPEPQVPEEAVKRPKVSKAGRKPMSLYLEDETRERVRIAAQKHKRSSTSLIEWIVEQWLNTDEAKEKNG